MTLQLQTPAPVTVAFTSDWHVGSGQASAGWIDRTVLRDTDGVPYVPGSTLTALWRDAAEQVALALDSALDEPRWSAWVVWMFGAEPTRARPGASNVASPGAVKITGAALEDDVRRVVCGHGATSALTAVRPGVKIDERTGLAVDDHLRMVEFARGRGLRFFSTVESDEPLPPPAVALLSAAARVLDRIGGKRRRGAGRCEITIDSEPDIEAIADALDAVPQPAPPRAQPDRGPLVFDEGPDAAGSWSVVRLRLELVGPVLSAAGVLGNVVQGHDFIPGGQLLPVIHEALVGAGADNAAVSRAVADGSLVVTDAVPTLAGEAMMRMPMCFERPKVSGAADQVVLHHHFLDPLEPAAQPKVVREGWLLRDPDGAVIRKESVLELQTHNAVDDLLQRPLENGLYAYEVIPARTVLAAEVRVRGELARWLTALESPRSIRLGRARRGDVGRVVLTGTACRAPEVAPVPATNRIIVWCLSDLLVRSQSLRSAPSVDDVRRELERRLGSRLVIDQSSVRHRRRSGWNVGWGLPRPDLTAIAAGSVMTFTVLGALDAEAIGELAVSGIGERCAEGFGQIAIDHELTTAATLRVTTTATMDDPIRHHLRSDASEPADRGPSQEIVIAAWQREITRCANAAGMRRKAQMSKVPNAQLGVVRSLISSSRPSDATFQDLRRWIAHAGVKSANDNGTLPAWLQSLNAMLDSPAIWDEIADEGCATPQWVRQQCEVTARRSFLLGAVTAAARTKDATDAR